MKSRFLSLVFKMTVVLVVAALMFSLAACSEKSSSRGESSDEIDQDFIVKDDADSNVSDPNTDELEDPKEEQPDETDPEKSRYMSELAARYSAHEKNGYSLWWRKTLNDETHKCVDSQGYVAFEYSADADNETNVYNNCFIISERVRDENTFYSTYKLLKASTGETLYSTSDKDNQFIIDLEYSSTELFKDGYIIIVDKQETYNGVTYGMGIMGPNGQWLVPLSKDHPVIKQMGDFATLDHFKKMRYLGEDILHFTVNYDEHYFYNIRKNKIVKVNSELTESNTDSVLRCAGPFYKGVCVETYGFGGGICKVTADGKIVDMPINFSDKLHESFGAMYYDAKNDRIIRMGYTYHQDGFSVFDSKGAIIKKLSDVDVVEANGFTAEGLAQLVMQNKDGTKYYTMIDTAGNFLFDPIKMETGYVLDISGNQIDNGEISPANTYTIVDRTGKVLIQSKSGEEFGYKNGIAKQGDTYTVLVP